MLDNYSRQDEIYYLVYKLPAPKERSVDNNEQKTHVVMQFPLLEKDKLTVPELEYLIEFVRAKSCSPIRMTLTSTSISLPNSFNTKPTLQFPDNILPNLRHIYLPNWVSESTPYDYIPAVEQ